MSGNVHFILQGKGGVGKSLVAALLSQFLMESGEEPLIIDTDPVNRTLAGFSALQVHEIQLMNKNDIDASLFDKLMASVLEHEGDCVIDNGASSFVTLSSYLLRNEMVEFLAENEKRVTIHTVITGGQALYDTLNGMDAIVRQFPQDCQVVLWLNEFFGPIEEAGKTFTAMKAYKTHQARIAAMVTIEKQDELFEQATKLMLKQRMTFAEVAGCLEAELFDVFKKRRVAMFKKSLYGQLEVIRQGGVL